MMRRLMLVMGVIGWAATPSPLAGQFGDFGGRGGNQGRFGREPGAPKLPGSELDGPPDSDSLRALVDLTDTQAAQYRQAYDSFMVATRPQRDSARVATEKMNQRLDTGDRAAALFYAERLQELGKFLRERQTKFEDRLGRLLTTDQLKTYRRWKEEQERIIESRQREAALRWRMSGGFGGRMGGMGGGDEPRTVLTSPGVASPDLGAQLVRVGRTLYVAGQMATDSAGNLVGGTDLGAQARQALANLTAVLHSARAAPRDVIQMTIYVVNYRPADLATIRTAAASVFPTRDPPIMTVLGVQSLVREGARIAIQATAIAGAGGAPGER